MSFRDEIKFEGALLSVGDSRRIVCPACKGGETHERSMNISRTAEGILYKCHRATCDARGFVGTGASGLPQKPVERTPKHYEDELLALEPKDLAYLKQRFELAEGKALDNIMRNEHDEYVLPIYGPDGYVRGYNVRQPWEGAPREGRARQPKNAVYMHSIKPPQSTYEGDSTSHHILLVEDQLSAIKAAAYGSVTHAVALLGCHLDIPKVREIAMLRPFEVLLALDSDATDKAFKLARDFGLAFPKLRVVILEQDIKDTPAGDINKVLGI